MGGRFSFCIGPYQKANRCQRGGRGGPERCIEYGGALLDTIVILRSRLQWLEPNRVANTLFTSPGFRFCQHKPLRMRLLGRFNVAVSKRNGAGGVRPCPPDEGD